MSRVVADFDPSGLNGGGRSRSGTPLDIPFYEVDAHNVVPCFAASGRQEYAAGTFRPKVLRVLTISWRNTRRPRRATPSVEGRGETAWSADELLAVLPVDRGVREVRWVRPGTRAGMAALGSS